jgi:hypothetical protein
LANGTTNWLEVVTAVSTAIAAIFAAFSAWIAKQSVKAARDSVEEARLARKGDLAPRLILEKDFLDFQFFWPHASTLNGEPVFLARRHWKDNDPKPPTFTLENFGQSPALELSIEWELDDSGTNYTLPAALHELGLSVSEQTLGEASGVKTFMFKRSSNGNAFTGLPLYKKWTTDIPSCSPGQRRTIDFPVHILNTLFLRGLQNGATVGEQLTLTAKLSCHSMDGTEYTGQFRWHAMPFYYGQTSPVLVYGHFHELPIYPKPDGPRVE